MYLNKGATEENDLLMFFNILFCHLRNISYFDKVRDEI